MSERRVIFPAVDYFARGRAILPAYADTGALGIACPHCQAEPGEPCVKDDGRASKVPCVDRIAAADLTPATTPATETSAALDFSEPRRPKGVNR